MREDTLHFLVSPSLWAAITLGTLVLYRWLVSAVGITTSPGCETDHGGLQERTDGRDPCRGRLGGVGPPTEGIHLLRQNLLGVHVQHLVWQPLGSSKATGTRGQAPPWCPCGPHSPPTPAEPPVTQHCYVLQGMWKGARHTARAEKESSCEDRLL